MEKAHGFGIVDQGAPAALAIFKVALTSAAVSVSALKELTRDVAVSLDTPWVTLAL